MLEARGAVRKLEGISSAARQPRWAASRLQRKHRRLFAARARTLAPDCSSNSLPVIPSARALSARVAAHLGVDPAGLLLTNGVDEAIHLICETYLEPGDEVLIVRADVFDVRDLCRGNRGAGDAIPAGADFQLSDRRSAGAHLAAHAPDRDRQSEQSRPARVRRKRICCGFCAPRPMPPCWWMKRTSISTANRCWRKLRKVPNLFVARTFSKAYGLAGLRIGVLAGNAAQMAMVRRVSSPYNVNACRARVLAGGARRPRLYPPVRRRGSAGKGTAGAGAALAEATFLAEPGEFRADAHWRAPRCFRCGHAGARHPGAGPLARSRLRGLCPHQRRIERANRAVDRRTARGSSRRSPPTGVPA